MIAFTHLTSQYIPPVGSAPYQLLLLKRSLKQAKRESNRLSKALEAMRNAQPEEQQRFIFDEKEAPTATNDQGHHLIHKTSNQAQGITKRPVSDEKSQRGTHP